MRAFLSAVIVLLVGAGALANTSNVKLLKADNFKSIVTDDKLVLVKFFAPWCGHCKSMAPEYIKAADSLVEKENIVLAEVDCTEERDLCQEHEVQGYPTVKLFNRGKPEDYNGARTADGITGYMLKRVLPPLSRVEPEKLDDFVQTDKVVVVGFYDDDVADHMDEHQVLENIAKEKNQEVVFGYVEDVASAEKYGVKQPGLVLFKKFDDGKAVFSGEFTKENVEKFITENMTPVLDEIGPDNYMKYVQAETPLAYLFLDDNDSRESMQNIVRGVAKEFKGKMNFVWIDASKYSGHAESLNLKGDKWPAFAIQETQEQTKYPMDQSKTLTTESVKEFVEHYLDGKLEPSIKSDEIPEKNDEPVKVLVAKQFNEIVMEGKKDVLVEFYAPWCGHCKKLTPVYDELGKKFEKHGDKIVIAKMDATTNDVPPGSKISVSGFPTLKLVTASNKVIDYEGDRSLESLTKFVLDNAENKVELEGEKKEEDKKEEDKKEEDKKEEDKKEEDKKEHDEL